MNLTRKLYHHCSPCQKLFEYLKIILNICWTHSIIRQLRIVLDLLIDFVDFDFGALIYSTHWNKAIGAISKTIMPLSQSQKGQSGNHNTPFAKAKGPI